TVTHYRIDSIMWGALVALTYRWARPRAWLALAAAFLVVATLVATGDLSVVPPGSPLGLGLGYTGLATMAAALGASVRDHPRGLLVRVLDTPAMVMLGRLSYA